ncbi:hypothetical protein [Geobacter sp. SVR]|uniref:hypothetical protein n=1 Tax=Geobacter sp. SVR TaxID=2495594 RepID=UPI00143F010C|nr:hypothetical protein [Geobacter sp. SVR]BCS54077.1 hypothetical protein GSVR_23850 [Geobacter sp. SVR]GCF87560.1 hypothetical protein GSbR_41600 [Geobacter sp. SVR]
MSIDKALLLAFFEEQQKCEADKKEIVVEIKEAFATFAYNNELIKKSVRRVYKLYKEFQKDNEFVLVDSETDLLLDTVIPVYSEDADAAAVAQG